MQINESIIFLLICFLYVLMHYFVLFNLLLTLFFASFLQNFYRERGKYKLRFGASVSQFILLASLKT